MRTRTALFALLATQWIPVASTAELDPALQSAPADAFVAAMIAITRSIGMVVSESGGTVTVFRDGRLEKQIEP